MNIFISYSSRNTSIAQELCQFLEEHGQRCFFSPRDIRPGMEYAEEIVNGIDRSDALVLLLSQYANQSPHILREIERAVNCSVPIIIFKLEPVKLTKSMEYFLMTCQWIENDSYEGLLCAIKNIAANRLRTADEKADTAENVSSGDSAERKFAGYGGRFKRSIAVTAVIAASVAALGLMVHLFSKTDGMDRNTTVVQGQDSPAGGDEAVRSTEGNAQGTATAQIQTLLSGDTVQFGTYLGKAIDWRVLHISEDGRNAILIAKDILTMKAYDAAEGGTYNQYGGKSYWGHTAESDTDMDLQATLRGNSDWSLSNIRLWLNSEKEVVQYSGQAPIKAAMSEQRNGYAAEEGFLHGFSKEELAVLKPVGICTKGNPLSNNQIITTQDRVFLLSLEELNWFQESSISLLAKPTDEARQQDATDWYEAYSLGVGIENFYWLLREPVAGSASKIYCVGDGYTEDNLFERQAGLEGYGIRPAVSVDVEGLMKLKGLIIQ